MLGIKGASLASMTRLGLSVPAGFTVSSEIGAQLDPDHGASLPDEVEAQMRAALRQVEETTGRRFGDPKCPLLLSVRSGASASMPGMMSTILDLGMNEAVVESLAKEAGGRWFAFDCYRRFLASYGEHVLGLSAAPHEGQNPFMTASYALRRNRGVGDEFSLRTDALEELIETYRAIIAERAAAPIPEDPWQQLMAASVAAFRSWHRPECESFRRRHQIPHQGGTAVNVCTMVFGNRGTRSATGVAFTRDPSTGERRFFGEYLPRAQGEDVVSGTRIPLPINGGGDPSRTLAETMPEVHDELERVSKLLEGEYREIQDVEFTVEEGKLWLLQTRAGAPSAEAAVRIAVDMVDEGMIDPDEAIRRVTPDQMERLLRPRLEDNAGSAAFARGLAASPGIATGVVSMSAEDAERRHAAGESVVLVRQDTSTNDVRGIQASVAVLTAQGGLTCHAAIVARALGKPCVVGAAELRVDYQQGEFSARGKTLCAGDLITVDGTTGTVMEGAPPTIEPSRVLGLKRLLEWVDERVEGEAPTEIVERLQAAQAQLDKEVE
jgi:pyruvate, orthophosphate dikinase